MIFNEFKEKVLQIKRVTCVVKGGKKLSFQALIVIGNFNGKVSIGIGKGEEVSLALAKARLNAKKNLLLVRRTNNNSVNDYIKIKFGASKIMLKPSKYQSGLVASGVIHAILEFGGFKNVITKQFGSTNLINNAKAVILALFKLNNN